MRLVFLPEGIRRHLRPLPQWTPVGARDSLDPVRVHVVAGGLQFDVTQNHVIAALRPFTLALGLNAPLRQALQSEWAPVLHFVDADAGYAIAWLQLRFVGFLHAGGSDIALFHVVRHQQRCVRWPYRVWNRWLQNRAAARNRDPANFAMTPDSQQQIMVFYIRPRPVVLVSVECAEHCNIFPMDLIGPLLPGLFTLALRNTSRSIESMKLSRRVALSDIAATDVQIAHALGRHHRPGVIDWNALPFAIERSSLLSLPVPDIALRVRELEITDFFVIGSHTLFICRPLLERHIRDSTPLCHISGIAQHLRTRQRRSSPPVPSPHTCQTG